MTGRPPIPASPRGARRSGLPWTLLIVAAVLLGGLAVVADMSSTKCLRTDRAETDLDNLRAALELYQQRHGHWPEAAEGLGALVADGIIRKMPKDPWGNDYRYAREGGAAVITSLGADGVPGGRCARADLSRTLTAPRARTSP